MTEPVSDRAYEELVAENRALRKEVGDLTRRVTELEQALQQALAGLEHVLLREYVSDEPEVEGGRG